MKKQVEIRNGISLEPRGGTVTVSIAWGFRLFGNKRFHHMARCNEAVPEDASLF